MRAPNYLVRRRKPGTTSKWEPWETLSKHDKEDAALANCPRDEDGSQTAVWLQGKIIHWFEGKKCLTSKSRAEPPPIVKAALIDDSDEYGVFTWTYGPTKIVAQGVARDEDTAARMLENATDGWDLEKLQMTRGPLGGHPRRNHWLYLDAMWAPRINQVAE